MISAGALKQRSHSSHASWTLRLWVNDAQSIKWLPQTRTRHAYGGFSGDDTVPQTRLPDRIYPDALIEALVEIQFETPEISELVVGRLLDAHAWHDFNRTRLPIADVPQPIRDADPGLKFQPIFDLRGHSGARAVKIGGHVISYHSLGAYPGWRVLSQEVFEAIAVLYRLIRDITITRIGFRYVNIFRSEMHDVGAITDLQVSVTVGSEILSSSLNINYNRDLAEDHLATIRIATPDLVQGPVPPGYTAYCDIDIASRLGSSLLTEAEVRTWIETAHALEKAEFFRILGPQLTAKLADPEREKK